MMHNEPTATGAQRRVRALMARAWSPEAISRRAEDVRPALIRKVLARPGQLNPDDVQAISRVYEALWDKEPPRVTEQDRAAADAHQERARRSGWAVPLAWDDDEIDDPAARPAEGWRPTGRQSIPSAALVENAEFVREAGGYRLASTAAVAMRLGVKRDALEQAYIRQRGREATAGQEWELEAG